MLNIRSKITEKILGVYFINPESRYYINELARHLDVDPGNLDRKLKELEGDGILNSERIGNQKYFFLNQKYFFLKELKNLYQSKYGLEKKIANSLKNLKGLSDAYIFGSYAKGSMNSTSDIDILLIGNHSSVEAKRLINKIGEDVRRELNVIDLSEEEFKKRKKENDEFIKNIFKAKIIKLK